MAKKEKRKWIVLCLKRYEATMVSALGNTTTMANNVAGDVTKTTNALGNATTMAYDPATGMETGSTDPLGNASLTQYDLFDQGQVLDSVAAVGSTVQADTLNQYNLAGEDTGARNADGYWSTNILDPLDRITGTVDSLGDTTQTNYDLAGQEVSSRDSVGDWTCNQYNSQGLVSETIDPRGNVTTMAYNAIGLITSQTDPSGNVTTYLYDALDRVTAETTPLGTSTTMYDAAGNTTETIDPQGDITKMAYDADNRNISTTTGYGTSQAETTTQAYDAIGEVTSSTDAAGNVTTMAYDAIGQNTTTTAPTGLVTSMAYDADGDNTVVTNPLSQSTTMSYNALNQQTQTTDALGNVTTQVLDPVGQTVGSVAPDYAVNQTVPNSVGETIYTSDNLGNLTKKVYDANGDLVSETDPNGNTTQWTYNSNGQELTETDALGNVTKMAYNSSGWLTSETDPEGNVTTYGYDSQGRQITVETPDGGVTTTAYNSISEVTSVTDPLGHTTSYQYDSQGNQTVVTNALGYKTTMTYNQDNQETSLTDPDGNVTTFAYNSLNEETLTTNPLGYKTTTTYNSNEQVSTVTDPDGREDIYSYDSDGQNTSVVWKNSSGTTVNTLTYTYDSSGNVLTAANAAGTYTMGYDADNRETTVAGLFGVTLTYAYDAAGNRTTVQDMEATGTPTTGTTTVVYNADNEWTTIEETNSTTSQMREDQSYTADSLPSTDNRYSNLAGTSKVGETDYSYNPNSDVSNITDKNGSGTVLQQVTYSYDQADRVTTQNLNGTTSSYLYDAVNELTSDSVHSYSYDPNGNRNSTGYSTGTGNELLNDGTYTYTYDNAGNLVEKSKGTGLQTWYYTYDNKDNLLTVNETSNGTTSIMTATYSYDVFGNMVQEAEWQTGGSAVTTEHVYDQQTGNLLLDLSSSNVVQMRYLFGTSQNEYLGRQDGSGNASWYLTDRLGSVIGLTNGSGTATDTIGYDGFGNITSNSAPTVTGNIGFQGMFTDPATGQSGSGARQEEYSPTTGSWTNPDPSGLTSGSNPYEAMGNEPSNATDPSGLEQVTVVAKQGTGLNQGFAAGLNMFGANLGVKGALLRLKSKWALGMRLQGNFDNQSDSWKNLDVDLFGQNTNTATNTLFTLDPKDFLAYTNELGMLLQAGKKLASLGGNQVPSTKSPLQGTAITLTGSYKYVTGFTSPVSVSNIRQEAPLRGTMTNQWVLSAKVKFSIHQINSEGLQIVPTFAAVGDDGKPLPANKQLGYTIIGGACDVTEDGILEIQLAQSGAIRTIVTLQGYVTDLGWTVPTKALDSYLNVKSEEPSPFDERMNAYYSSATTSIGIATIGPGKSKDIPSNDACAPPLPQKNPPMPWQPN